MKTNTKLIALASVLFSIASLLAVISDVDAFNAVSSPTLEQVGNSWLPISGNIITNSNWNWINNIYYSWATIETFSNGMSYSFNNYHSKVIQKLDNDFDIHQIFADIYANSITTPDAGRFSKFIYNKTNQKIFVFSDNPYILLDPITSKIFVFRYNANNSVWPSIEAYELNKTTMELNALPYQLLPKPVLTVPDYPWYTDVLQWIYDTAPSTEYVEPAQFPLYFQTKWGNKVWTYKGTDGRNYTYDTNGNFTQNETMADVLNPSFAFSWNTSFFITPSTAGSGSYIVSNHTANRLQKTGPFPYIKTVTSFINPTLYVRGIDDQLYSWDMNCDNPEYSTCRFDYTKQANYCAWEPGVFDPRDIPCWTPVSLDITNTGGSSGSSSGSSYLTDVGYTPTPQTCTWVTFSGTTTLTNTTEDLQPLTCTWRTLSGSYQCQDINAHICTSNGDACLQQIDNPSQYAGSGTVTTTEVTRLNCTSATKSCTWVDKNTCGNSTDCYVDWNACKVKPTLTLPNVPTVAESNYVNPLRATGSIVKTQGTTPGIVYSTWSTTTCELFDDNGNFIYTNTSLYTFQYDFTAVTDIQALKIPLGYLNRVQEFVTRPVNTLLGLGSSFIPPENGSKVCLMGISYPVEYQSFLKLANGTGTTIWPFKDAPTLNFDGTKRTVIDYFVIIFFLVSAWSIAWMLFYFVKHS